MEGVGASFYFYASLVPAAGAAAMLMAWWAGQVAGKNARMGLM